MWLFILALHAAFIWFFSFIGYRWVGLLPLLVVSIIILHIGNFFETEGTAVGISGEEMKSMAITYALPVARTAVVFGIRGISDVYSGGGYEVPLLLILAHILLWLWSYIARYEDGKRIFQRWYVFSLVLRLYFLWKDTSFGVWIHMVMVAIAVTMAIAAAIVFICPVLGWVYKKSDTYLLFVTWNLTVMFGIYAFTRQQAYLGTLLGLLYVTLVYTVMVLIRRYTVHIKRREDSQKDPFFSILAGKKLFDQKEPMKLDLLLEAQQFLQKLDPSTKLAMSMLNVFVMGLLIYFFLTRSDQMPLIAHELIFWCGIAAFFVNYLLLRTLGFYHEVQRVGSFLLITFGMYATSMHVFDGEVIYLFLFGIGRTIINSAAMFHTRFMGLHTLLQAQDYWYRIGATMLASLCNLYFVFLLPISGQLAFSLSCLYLGVQGVLTWYTIMYVKKNIREY